MNALSELEKLEDCRSLLEDIIELQKRVTPITQDDFEALAEYVANLRKATELSAQLR